MSKKSRNWNLSETILPSHFNDTADEYGYHLFEVKRCENCGRELKKGEKSLCKKCQSEDEGWK